MTGAKPAPAHLGPDGASRRVDDLDVLRGFALLGIFLVHILGYLSPPSTGVDRAAVVAVDVLLRGSFFPLFSMLFGMTFVLMEQAGARRGSFVAMFIRRQLSLLVIGVLSILLLDDYPILTRFAVLGFPLLLFRAARDRTLLVAGFALLVLATGSDGLARRLVRNPPPVAAADGGARAGQVPWYPRVLAPGGLPQAVSWRAARLTQEVRGLAHYSTYPEALMMFLVGLLVCRRRLLHEPMAHRELLGRCARWGVPVGTLCSAAVVWLAARPPDARWLGYLHLVAIPLGDLALMAGYVGVVVLFLHGRHGRAFCEPFRVVGRMGLTCFLLQSLFMSALFLPYGAGLAGRVSIPLGLSLAALLFGGQVALSAWWMRRHAYGPVEWVWRMASFGRRLPLRGERVRA